MTPQRLKEIRADVEIVSRHCRMCRYVHVDNISEYDHEFQYIPDQRRELLEALDQAEAVVEAARHVFDDELTDCDGDLYVEGSFPELKSALTAYDEGKNG